MSLTTIKNKYKGKWPLLISFSLFYSLIVLVMSVLFRFLPGGVDLENQLFDKIQQQITVDSKQDRFYNKYAHHINDLTLINLDSLFFDFETNRIRKLPLTQLLQVINQEKTAVQSVFLDYAYQKSNAADSLLNIELALLKDKLVLPIDFKIEGDIAIVGPKSEIGKDRIAQVNYPVYKDAVLGYTKPFVDPYSQTNRFFKYRLNDEFFVSAPWQLYKLSKYYDKNYANNFSNDIKEIKFILRNEDKYLNERAAIVYNASDIIDRTIDPSYLSNLIKGKTLIIGLFEDYETKYLNPIDKFTTPVTPRMGGALLITNTYLNLTTQTELKGHNWILFFIINCIVGLFIALNYEKNVQSRYVSLISLFFDFFISMVLFYTIAYLFYAYFSIKMGLGIALLLYQKKYYFFTWYHGWFNDNFTKILEEGED